MFIFDFKSKNEYMALRGIDFWGPAYNGACMSTMILVLMTYVLRFWKGKTACIGVLLSNINGVLFMDLVLLNTCFHAWYVPDCEDRERLE